MKIPTILLTALLIAVIAGCGGGGETKDLAGAYAAKTANGLVISLELSPNGQGTLKNDLDNQAFKWEIRNNELWLHTKSGGVITGRYSGENEKSVLIDLPGVGRMDFRKKD